MSYSLLATLGKAFILFCDLHSAGYAYGEMRKYLASDIEQSVRLRGYSETALTMCPLSPRAHATFAQLETADDFFAFFGTIFPDHRQEDIPRLRAKICTQYNLYQFQGFLAFIRMFPEYPGHLLAMAERLKADKKFHGLISNVQGFAKHGLCEFIQQECAAHGVAQITIPCC